MMHPSIAMPAIGHKRSSTGVSFQVAQLHNTSPDSEAATSNGREQRG